MIKRVISLVLTLILLCFVCVFSVFASPETTESTTKPTVKPTEPPLNLTNYKHSDYVKKMDKLTYDGDLGAIYSKDKTDFHFWSPTAKSVTLCIYNKGSKEEKDSELVSETKMKFNNKNGHWYTSLEGDYDGYYYTYKVEVENTTNEIVDPYAKACGVNGDRGMIVDLSTTNPDSWYDNEFTPVEYNNDAVIYELSIRDFTSSDTSGISSENRGKYLAFTESDTKVNNSNTDLPSCVSYLKDLGVNYVEINPFYDFASIDETQSLDKQYNWGYDPKNYNVPEGSYSSNPYDGKVRIKECKEMINALHKAGIGVIMDVVYNHTYESENSFLNMAVPEYYYRISDDKKWSNGSGCGNDIATERTMVRKLIVDSVNYWAYEYQIDGFRFDLMGLIDVDTMNAVRFSLDEQKNGDCKIILGEAWKLNTDVDSSVKLANQDNMSKLSSRIAAFNDTFRDGIKGSTTNKKEKGFIQDGSSKSKVKSGIEGMSLTEWADLPTQCVNYASCHDNMTLYDKLIDSVKDNEDYDTRYEDLVSMNKLSALATFTSQGIPFLLSGEEMGRTKHGDDNSYKSDISVNEINWNNASKYRELSLYYKGLIDIRKTFKIFRDPTKTTASSIKYIENAGEGVIAYTMFDNDTSVCVVLNGSDEEKSLNIGDISYEQLANEKIASLSSLKTITDGEVIVKAHSGAIFVDTNSYSKLETTNNDYVFINYVDTSSDSIVHQQIVTGKENEKYSVDPSDGFLMRYDIIGNSNVSGEFTEKTKDIEVRCKEYTGSFGTVKVLFVDEDNNEIYHDISMKNRTSQQYFTPYLPCVTGYKLDLDKLPSNGAGTYSNGETKVTYKYSKISKEENIEGLDSKFSNKANVIYLGSDGKVLETKSYMGVKDDFIDLDIKQFDNYQYIGASNEEPRFSEDENNIVLMYQKDKSTLSSLIFVIGGLLILVIIAVLIINAISKKKNKKEIYIDE